MPCASNAAVRVFFALVLVVYVGVFPYLAALKNPNEDVRTYMTMALVEDHTLAIDRIVARHGWVNDMAKVQAPGAGAGAGTDRLYSVKAPAVSLLGVPVYAALVAVAPRVGLPVPSLDAPAETRARWLRVATFVLRLFVVQLPCFAFLLAFERWLRRVSPDATLRLSAVAAAGLGTNYLAYSHMFASHALFAVATFASFALITDERAYAGASAARARPSRLLLAGLFAGLATLLEYHALPVSLALALYALTVARRPRALAAFAVGAALCAAVLCLFQWRAFGDPRMPGHLSSENEDYQATLSQGFFGLGRPSGRALRLLTESRAFGFFGTSPFMLLGLGAVLAGIVWPAGPSDARRALRVTTVAWLATMAVLWVTVSAAVNWRGGWTIGPRYLGAAPPFFAYGAVLVLARASALWPALVDAVRALAVGLAAASAAQSGLVSIVVSSLPETVTRPLPQIAWPLVRGGYLPYTVADLVGLTPMLGAYVFYVVAACLGAAVVVAAIAASPRPSARLALRLAGAALVAWLALRAALRPPTDPRADGAADRAAFERAWEPRLRLR